ncbi:hypothetical protein AAFC00_002684 [Neodothiora populina]|uniref:Protein-lysine N-methyltransferase EFM6 n=1 Tax=Neodothiora populina TaxID=2781224 RepID=A0ABR3P7V0_9PEZI
MSDNSDDEGTGVFAISEDLVPNREHKAAGVLTVDFDGLLETGPLKLREDLTEGCGGMLWPAGIVLSRYLLRQDKDYMRHKTIVELGAGGGLVGLSIALGFETDSPIHLTDQLPMLGLLKQNIALNSLMSRVKASIYDWGNAVPSDLPQHPDILLAAECVYFEPAFPLLQQTLRDLIGPNTVCYFCFKKRRRADLHFMKAIRKTFVVEDVADDPEKPVWSRENLFLYRITLKEQKV